MKKKTKRIKRDRKKIAIKAMEYKELAERYKREMNEIVSIYERR